MTEHEQNSHHANMRNNPDIADSSEKLALKPTALLEIEHYSDDQIAHWDNEDKLDVDQREHLLDSLQRK